MPADDQPPQPQQPLNVNLDVVGLEASTDVSEDRESQKERKLFGEPRRREQFSQVIHFIRLVVLCVGMISVLSLFVVRGLHMILPENTSANAGSWIPHCWLTAVQLSSMDTLIYGAILAFVAEYGAKSLISGRLKN